MGLCRAVRVGGRSSAIADSRSRRTRWPTIRRRSPTRRRRSGERSHATTGSRSAGCIGCWWRRAGCRSAARRRGSRPDARRDRPADRAVRRSSAAAISCTARRRSATRSPARASPTRWRARPTPGSPPASMRGTLRRHLLHRAAGARPDAGAQHRRRGGGDRRGRGAAESEDDARHQFGRRDGDRAAAGADRPLVADRASSRTCSSTTATGAGPARATTASRRSSRRSRGSGYAGWLAMEPFDYVPDGPGCAAHCDRLRARAARGPA